jgi:hypothetical protein
MYKPPFPIDKGFLDGNESTTGYKKLLREMKRQCSNIDMDYAKCCIQSNLKNSLTSHYHLLIKKNKILSESLSEFSEIEQNEELNTNRRRLNKNQIPIPYTQ